MISSEILDEAVSRIVQVAHPLKVILFGSYARETADHNSDLDFLVIGYFDTPKSKMFMRINRALNGLGIDRDIVLMSPESYEISKQISGLVAYPVEREGKILYESP